MSTCVTLQQTFFFESLWQSSVVNRLKYLDRTLCATLPNTFTCTRKSEQSAGLPKLGSFRFLTRNVVKDNAIFGTLCALLMNLLIVEQSESTICVSVWRNLIQYLVMVSTGFNCYLVEDTRGSPKKQHRLLKPNPIDELQNWSKTEVPICHQMQRINCQNLSLQNRNYGLKNTNVLI